MQTPFLDTNFCIHDIEESITINSKTPNFINNYYNIIQLFILTHNTYFHKEISFFGIRDYNKPNEILFGILNKKDNQMYQ